MLTVSTTPWTRINWRLWRYDWWKYI